MKIINKKTKEVYEVIGLFSDTVGRDTILIGNVKTKALSVITSFEIVRDYELKVERTKKSKK